MARYPFALIGVVFVASLTRGDSEKDWQLYTDHVYRLTLRFPQGWRKPAEIYQDRPYFEGSDGSFQLGASEGDTPRQVCRGAATHHLHPYGSLPQIQSMKIQGQKACVVWPSEEQGARADAELVVQYPRPVYIDGRPWPQLTLIAEKTHMLGIARTLRFLTSK